jgi:hypothetical protein
MRRDRCTELIYVKESGIGKAACEGVWGKGPRWMFESRFLSLGKHLLAGFDVILSIHRWTFYSLTRNKTCRIPVLARVCLEGAVTGVGYRPHAIITDSSDFW